MNESNKLSGALDKLRGRGDFIWLGLAGLLVTGFAFFSVADIEPGQLALKVNNLTGAQTIIAQPGWTTRIPLLQSVYILDGKPLTFSMKNNQPADDLHVEELSVRASDGSNFHFTDTTIIFKMTPSRVDRTVRDSGQGYGFLAWMTPYARAILRDEFGRESTIDVSNPTTYGEAATRARNRLNSVLRPHGIEVTQLVTPRPRFSNDYEHAIEERNGLGNQLEVIRSDLDRAQTNRARQLAELDQEKNQVIQQRRAELESELARATARQAETRRGADSYAIEKIAEGQAARSASNARAQQLAAELDARYQSRQAEVAAFRVQPVARLMERLGETLRGVTIAIQPWSEDSTPSRVNVNNTTAAGGAR